MISNIALVFFVCFCFSALAKTLRIICYFWDHAALGPLPCYHFNEKLVFPYAIDK